MITPCGNCPFRLDVEAYIRPARGREIRASLQQGGMFPCHKTVDYSGDGEGRITPASQFCSGALALMEKQGGAHMNQMVRIQGRLGLLDLDDLDPKAPVPDTWDEWFQHLGEEVSSLGYCDVAGSDCSNPVGFGGGGTVMDNEDPPACSPDNSCEVCGSVSCGACLDEDDICETCYEG